MNLPTDLPLSYLVGAGSVVLALVILSIFLFAGKRKKTQTKTQIQTEATPTKEIEVRDAPKKLGMAELLSKTTQAFTSKLESLILSTKNFDDSFVESLEELLFTSDLGPKTVERLLQSVRSRLSRGELKDLNSVKETLYEEVVTILSRANQNLVSLEKNNLGSTSPKPWVVLVVGVNGVGKTTSIGKLAQYFSNKGQRVLIVAGDTFRAAAEQQLAVWGERAHVEVYTSDQTRDPAAIAFQGIQKGKAENFDVIIVDTAGRLHNKENLMNELKKVKRVADKANPGAPNEVILVIDANNGQNAKVQAQQFNEALGVTSLIVTKLDGTARGGVIVSIAEEVGLGVQFIGTGEKISDLQEFSSSEYAKELLKI